MDSKIVNKEIRTEIRPFLRDAGFSKFTGRNSWRFVESRIDVVNFQSFNSYNASVIGCTTYSFSVNLGCFFTNVPYEYGGTGVKQKDGQYLPEEFECYFRGRLKRNFPQPECDHRNIWYIDPEGTYLKKALHDVRMALARDAFEWFDRLAQPEEVLRILLEDDPIMGSLWGFGRNPSPIRHYLTGYFSLNQGRVELAMTHLHSALESGRFDQVADRIQLDLANAIGNSIDR